MRKCQECGSEITKITNQTFCSRLCANRYKAKSIDHSVKGVPRITACKQCGVIFKYTGKERLFCSSKCSAIFNNSLRSSGRQPTDSISCKTCGLSFPYKKGQMYCSNKCQAIYQRNRMKLKWLETGTTGQSPTQEARAVKAFLILDVGDACEQCGFSAINPISGNSIIQLDHIDGDCTNNSRGNVRLLCPNCHALTPTFGTLNMGSGRLTRLGKR